MRNAKKSWPHLQYARRMCSKFGHLYFGTARYQTCRRCLLVIRTER